MRVGAGAGSPGSLRPVRGPRPRRWNTPRPTSRFPPTRCSRPTCNVPVGTWLGGTRWAVVSDDAREAAVVDFAGKSRRALGGRKGRDAEIRNPVSAFVSADTIWVTDWALGRVHALDVAGQAAGAVPSPPELRGSLPASRATPPASSTTRSGPTRGATAAATATPPRSCARCRVAARFDTVGRLSPLDLAEVAGRRRPPLRAPRVQRPGSVGGVRGTDRSGSRGSIRIT